jgi:hypothetical protein
VKLTDLRTHEHQVVSRPRTSQLLGQGFDHDPGEPDPPVASSGLGRPEMQVATDLGDDLHHLDHPTVQVDTAAAKPSHLADPKAAIGNHAGIYGGPMTLPRSW